MQDLKKHVQSYELRPCLDIHVCKEHVIDNDAVAQNY